LPILKTSAEKNTLKPAALPYLLEGKINHQPSRENNSLIVAEQASCKLKLPA
jgi:hypothetical protein